MVGFSVRSLMIRRKESQVLLTSSYRHGSWSLCAQGRAVITRRWIVVSLSSDAASPRWWALQDRSGASGRDDNAHDRSTLSTLPARFEYFWTFWYLGDWSLEVFMRAKSHILPHTLSNLILRFEVRKSKTSNRISYRNRLNTFNSSICRWTMMMMINSWMNMTRHGRRKGW